MKYYLLAGEASGDLHGANLMKAIRQLDPQAIFRIWGGDLMEKEGGINVSHVRERAFMGFGEVIRNLFTIRKLIKLAKKDILEFKPERLIFIDYPGFNLRIAAWAHRQGFETHYYISPKVWAWNTQRAFKIKKIISRMYTILPFEVDFYKKFGYEVQYVGNPIVDAIAGFKPDTGFRSNFGFDSRPIIALLPGSRRQETDNILPGMLKAVEPFKEAYNLALAAAPDFDTQYFSRFKDIGLVTLVRGQTYNLLANSTAALVTSGTATLETALFHVPQIVCYKTSAFNYVLAKWLIKVPFISLVNLIMGSEVVKELIQDDFNPKLIKKELTIILSGPGRDLMLQKYLELERIIGSAGASERTARLIVNHA